MRMILNDILISFACIGFIDVHGRNGFQLLELRQALNRLIADLS